MQDKFVSFPCHERRGSAERGVLLIEVLLAITILSVVVIALGAVMYQTAVHSRASGAHTARSAATQRSTAWAEQTQWVNLTTQCTLDTIGNHVFDSCAGVADVTPTHKQLTMTVTPLTGLNLTPDTFVVDRYRYTAVNPLRK